MDKPDLFAVSNESTLRSLPIWLMRRTYNKALEGLFDKNGKALIPLQCSTPAGMSKAGIIVIVQGDLYDRVCDIIETTAVDPSFEFLVVSKSAPDIETEFFDLVRQYEHVMQPQHAISAACAVLDIDDKEAQRLLAKAA